MRQGVKKIGGILHLRTRPSRQTERALPGDSHRPTHEEISLASGRHPLKSDKTGTMSLDLTVNSTRRTKTQDSEGDGIFYVRLFGF